MRQYIVQRQNISWARDAWRCVKLVEAKSARDAILPFAYLADDNKLRALTVEAAKQDDYMAVIRFLDDTKAKGV